MKAALGNEAVLPRVVRHEAHVRLKTNVHTILIAKRDTPASSGKKLREKRRSPLGELSERARNRPAAKMRTRVAALQRRERRGKSWLRQIGRAACRERG